MKLYIIQTENLRYYVMNERGELTQYNHSKRPEEYEFSGHWRVLGLSKVLPFGHIAPMQNALELIGQKLKYKNGRGAYVLHDFDYGTHRVWGDRITAIYKHGATA